MLILLFSCLLAGAFAGLSAGLLGIGGGIVVVPVLIVVFESQGFAPETLTHMAIATSLAAIVCTSFSSVQGHWRAGSIDLVLLRALALGLVPGVLLGVVLASVLDGTWLRGLFGLFACVFALRMWASSEQPASVWSLSRRTLPAFGVAVGAVSALLGIGGGTVTVPLLTRFGIDMRHCIGTAAAVGLPISVVGMLANIWVGLAEPGRPEWSLGYVYAPALIGISLASVPFARVGVKLSQRLPVKVLQQIFALLLLVVGIRFILA
jgi:uncharacterized membrane protein YfcA